MEKLHRYNTTTNTMLCHWAHTKAIVFEMFRQYWWQKWRIIDMNKKTVALTCKLKQNKLNKKHNVTLGVCREHCSVLNSVLLLFPFYAEHMRLLMYGCMYMFYTLFLVGYSTLYLYHITLWVTYSYVLYILNSYRHTHANSQNKYIFHPFWTLHQNHIGIGTKALKWLCR